MNFAGIEVLAPVLVIMVLLLMTTIVLTIKLIQVNRKQQHSNLDPEPEVLVREKPRLKSQETVSLENGPLFNGTVE